MTANQISYAKLQEDIRHNVQQERYNERMADIQEMNAYTNRQNVYVASQQVAVNAAQVNESARHNAITEQQNETHLVNEQTSSVGGFIGNIARVIGLLA